MAESNVIMLANRQGNAPVAPNGFTFGQPPSMPQRDTQVSGSGDDTKVIEWLFRVTHTELPIEALKAPPTTVKHAVQDRPAAESDDDWQAVESVAGYGRGAFTHAGSDLPLTAAEVGHFRRNHRSTESAMSGHFHSGSANLPDSLASLYALYLNQAQADAESALFLAQASGSTRVARRMSDLLALGAFACGSRAVCHEGRFYTIAAAFETSLFIDIANSEAASRLLLPVEHCDHLLKLSPDDIGLMAAAMVREHALDAVGFLRKANALSEARQDVNRFPVHDQFRIALEEGDLPISENWVQRLLGAHERLFPAWFAHGPAFDPATPRRVTGRTQR